jgi:hypothetical protein
MRFCLFFYSSSFSSSLFAHMKMHWLLACLELAALVDGRVSRNLIRPSIHPPIDRIEALDLTRARAQLIKWHPVWSGDKVDGALTEYRRFLAIGVAHGQAYLVPPPVIDEVWHAHILDTVNYMRDTTNLFGTYLHHTTSEQPQGEGTAEYDTFLKAGKLYAEMFDTPQREEFWGAPNSSLNMHSTSSTASISGIRKKIRPIGNKPRLELNCGPSPPAGACSGRGGSAPTIATAFTSKSWVIQNVSGEH